MIATSAVHAPVFTVIMTRRSSSFRVLVEFTCGWNSINTYKPRFLPSELGLLKMMEEVDHGEHDHNVDDGSGDPDRYLESLDDNAAAVGVVSVGMILTRMVGLMRGANDGA